MTDYHIATTGNDTTGDGSEGTPWATLAKFLASSASGDTCICAAGTYTWETATIAGRTIRGESWANPAIFDGGAAALIWTLTGASTFQHLIFQDAVTGTGVTTFFRQNTSGLVLFEDVLFRDLTWNADANCGFVSPAIGGASPTMHSRFVACTFDDILCGASSGRILFSHRAGGASNVPLLMEFINCILYFAATSPSTFTHLFQEHDTSVELAVEMTNTIILNETGQALGWLAGGVAIESTLVNSCFRNITDVPAGTGIITADPLFYDAGSGNFNLDWDSPAVGTGVRL